MVINSPRLIADSYVLLRLLMPRHPPCALKNLTTHMQSTKLYRENHENQHQQPKSSASDPGSIISKKLLLYKDARVHYVVLKQQPHHTHPHHSTNQTPPTKMENTQSTPRSSSVMPRNTKDQPTPHLTPTPTHSAEEETRQKRVVVAPGPNSVPNTSPPHNQQP